MNTQPATIQQALLSIAETETDRIEELKRGIRTDSLEKKIIEATARKELATNLYNALIMGVLL